MTTETPRVAIIVPVYNVEPYIGECLRSILTQTYPHFKAFCVDDGSPDGSGRICDAFALKDPRFRIIHKPNGGVSSARNAALEEIEADGTFDFISFIDSDDYVADEFLEKLVTAAVEADADYAFCNTIRFKDGEKPVPQEFHIPAVKLDRQGILAQYLNLNEWEKYKAGGRQSLFNRLFKAKLLKSLRFDLRLRTGEDVRFFSMAAEHLNSGVTVNLPLYFYRIRTGSLTRKPGSAAPAAPNQAAANPEKEAPGFKNHELRLDTTRRFMALAPAGSELYQSIHQNLVDQYWGALRDAYLKNDPEEIAAWKDGFKKEMASLSGKKLHHYRMLFMLALGDGYMRNYCLKRKDRKK